jgi:RNA polymerase sigma-70 factor (sigma-E family)
MRQSDEDEFVAFAHAQSHRLYRTAYLMVGDHQLAEDLVQVTLTKVYVRWGRIASMEQPGAFARKVLVNQATSWWRRRSSSELPMPVPDRPGAEHADRVATSRTVWNAVLTLPPRQRAVVVLRYYEDLTEADTADVLGMAVGTVKSHASAANRTLATVLADSGATEPARRHTS